MPPHRFYLPPEQCRAPELMLAGREAHHALHVLRLRPGDRVIVLDGEGQQVLGEIQAHDRDKIRVGIIERRSIPPPACQITLLQALPKGKLIESIIEKATELGALRVVPLLSERVVTRVSQKRLDKTPRWQLTALEAIKQCGSAWLPKVEPPITPAEFLARKENFDLALLASLQPGAKHPREYFRQFREQHGHLPQSLCVWVGPEGDFTPAEVQAIQAAGTLPITLGPLVLRTETAAIYCLSILSYELQATG